MIITSNSILTSDMLVRTLAAKNFIQHPANICINLDYLFIIILKLIRIYTNTDERLTNEVIKLTINLLEKKLHKSITGIPHKI